ncbi:aminotransferase class IV [Novosphingobium flavum]|uniref:Probable branched-chain-amino-acid aminotransferase n=1 Tax=Novosphingobium aerophilum TaxID=2839843 RepID=A0A7X1F6L0_9SPHN|nr:aminotransferase class IV [Novosphingobium aerophilum]MBC2651346.1 aminotransferase class IV [Novosphingobium aerophilum]MBC2661188.1 aminotransferase class IV [Novosphingobium aerophilum]
MPGSQDFTPDTRNNAVMVLLNGQLVPAHDAQVSLFDAGFGLGDGVWEGLRLHKGALLFLEAHLDRLYHGAAALRIEIGLTREALTACLHDLLRANGMEDGAHLRLMVTRGRKSTINQDPRFALGAPTIAVTAEFKQRSAEARPLALAISAIRTSPPEIFDMHLNTHSRVNYIRALLDVIDAGADEAIMLDHRGFVASCNATNLFWVKDGTVFTSRDDFCFKGITRGNVMALCRDGVAPLRQGDWPPDHLLAADEVFVTGTMAGVTAAGSVNGRSLPSAPGPVTIAIAQAYERLKDSYAKEHAAP